VMTQWCAPKHGKPSADLSEVGFRSGQRLQRQIDLLKVAFVFTQSVNLVDCADDTTRFRQPASDANPTSQHQITAYRSKFRDKNDHSWSRSPDAFPSLLLANIKLWMECSVGERDGETFVVKTAVREGRRLFGISVAFFALFEPSGADFTVLLATFLRWVASLTPCYEEKRATAGKSIQTQHTSSKTRSYLHLLRLARVGSYFPHSLKSNIAGSRSRFHVAACDRRVGRLHGLILRHRTE
jgi:hypothetical protein